MLTVPAIVKALDRATADLYLEYTGGYRFEEHVVVPSLLELEEWHRRIEDGQRRVDEAELPKFWHQHFTQVLKSLRMQLVLDSAQPYKFIDGLSKALEELIIADDRCQQERAALVGAKLQRSHQLLGEVRLRLAQRSQVTRRQAILSVRTLKATARQVKGALDLYLTGVTRERLMALGVACDWFVSALGDLGPPVKEEALDYRRLLQEGYGLDADAIASWCFEEVIQVKDQLSSLARSIDKSRSPQEILAEDLGTYGTPGALRSAMEDWVAQARQQALTLMELPSGESCRVGPMTPLAKQTDLWGGYRGTGVFRQNLSGYLMLNEDNYQLLHQGWLQILAVHECYPGHHAHKVKTAASPLPDSFKCGHLAAEIQAEGIAQRSEKLLEHIFLQAAYPLFVQYRRLYSLVRLKVDLDLFMGGSDLAGAQDTYQTELGLDEERARAQARAHLVSPGAYVPHCVGMKQLAALEEEMGWDSEHFTNECFSYGYVSMDTFGGLLRMSPGERAAIKSAWREEMSG